MVRHKNIKEHIEEIKDAADLGTVKKSILVVLKEIDVEIGYLWSELDRRSK